MVPDARVVTIVTSAPHATDEGNSRTARLAATNVAAPGAQDIHAKKSVETVKITDRLAVTGYLSALEAGWAGARSVADRRSLEPRAVACWRISPRRR